MTSSATTLSTYTPLQLEQLKTPASQLRTPGKETSPRKSPSAISKRSEAELMHSARLDRSFRHRVRKVEKRLEESLNGGVDRVLGEQFKQTFERRTDAFEQTILHGLDAQKAEIAEEFETKAGIMGERFGTALEACFSPVVTKFEDGLKEVRDEIKKRFKEVGEEVGKSIKQMGEETRTGFNRIVAKIETNKKSGDQELGKRIRVVQDNQKWIAIALLAIAVILALYFASTLIYRYL